MLTNRATIGAIGINFAPAATNQAFIPHPNEHYLLPYPDHFAELANTQFEFLAGGTMVVWLTESTFRRLARLPPPRPIVAEFACNESPLYKSVHHPLTVTQKLTDSRDKPLPRAILGKTSIESPDVQLPTGLTEAFHAR